MAAQPEFDVEDAHKFFSAHCFNMAWELIEKSGRTVDEDEQMIRLAQASLWHWTERPDCSDKNLSIGCWQVSRIYALLGEAENARKYGHMCLEKTPRDEPFYLGYAHEALARAESVAGCLEKAQEQLAESWGHAEKVTNDEEKKLLVDDLKTLE